MLKRLITILSTFAILMVGGGITHASIQSKVSAQQLFQTSSSDVRAVERTWYGAYIIHYSRSATYAFAHNTELGFLIAGRWTPIGLGLSFFSWHVRGIYDNGQCLVTHFVPGNPWVTWIWAENC